MSEYMLYVWIVLIILSVVVEAITTQLVSIWFVAGGVTGLILNAMGVDPSVQLVVSAVITLILVLSTRPLIAKLFKREKIRTNSDRLIGETGVVIQEINNTAEQGQVRINRAVWTARSHGGEVLPLDTVVEVNSIEGVKLMVHQKEKIGGENL